jgi:hypothetical protein
MAENVNLASALALLLELKRNQGRLQVRDIQKTLKQTARRLEKLATGRLDPRELSAVEQVIYGNQTGFREYHDSVAADWLMKALSSTVGEDRAYDMVHDYRGLASEIAAACRKAVDDLESIRGVEGRPEIDWFGGFVAVLLYIASRDEIPPKVSTNQWTGLPQGRFFNLAVEFQKLLHVSMRTTKGALGQRLKRELGRRAR